MKAIVNATILCPVKGRIENGSILFDNKIKDVGSDIVVPKGIKTIDAKGKYVVSGF